MDERTIRPATIAPPTIILLPNWAILVKLDFQESACSPWDVYMVTPYASVLSSTSHDPSSQEAGCSSKRNAAREPPGDWSRWINQPQIAASRSSCTRSDATIARDPLMLHSIGGCQARQFEEADDSRESQTQG
ncbi:hypothetical protein R1flu_007051 [Riccia fluitans]|uniref:Uncharacterized protein n=1 Tax=Riccia fluitans TaxID=41844 RepID=A0ABD1Z1V9_9MARC